MKTETISFKSLEDDLCFKYVFSHVIVLKDLLDSFLQFLKCMERFYFTKIIPESYIMPNNKVLKAYYGDIVATLDNQSIISLEMYKGLFDKNAYNKSFSYMNRLFDENVAKEKNYKDAKMVISLNLIKGNFRRINNELVNKYHFCNSKSGKVIDNGNTILYLVRLDKVKNIQYTKNEERFITWLRVINAKTLEEMEQLVKGDKIMEETMKFVAEWNARSSKNGIERYIEEREEEAAEKTRNKERLEIATTMLNDDIDIPTIIKYTGLSIKEIEKLQKNI